MFQKTTLYDIFKLRIVLYFVVPIILAAIIILANHRLNTQHYYEMYNEFYINYTDDVFFDMDEEINAIVRREQWLKNDDVKLVFDSDAAVSDADARLAIQHLRKMKNDFDIVDSILIVNRKTDTVTATNGKATIEHYFGDVYKYQDYSFSYFKDIRYPADVI